MGCKRYNGEREFSMKDVAALGKKSAKALQRIFEVAGDLCGLSEGVIEKIAKN